MRIIHLSDVHVWRFVINPARLFNKRSWGMTELLLRRSRKFRLERLRDVVDQIKKRDADHLLITGDLTTTALPEEFRDAREALADLLVDPARATVVPGNHDRYTRSSVRLRKFEAWFGTFAPAGAYPWLRSLDEGTAILGLDPTRSHLTATGKLPSDQLARGVALLSELGARPRRLIVACHYPLGAPPAYDDELAHKRLVNAGDVAGWLSGVGPHLYCCGHVHAAWAFRPKGLPEQLCVNAGAPLLRDRTGHRPPGFVEMNLREGDVSVDHHAWAPEQGWVVRPLADAPGFFPPRDVVGRSAEVSPWPTRRP